MRSVSQVGYQHAERAAEIHRIAGALIPGYDTSLHTPAETTLFYREQVMVNDELWGVFEQGQLLGFVALLPGWIDHLYVDPDFHRSGVGAMLIVLAQSLQDELRLYTFQSNVRARAFYEAHGFAIQELTDGQRNEEKMPDMTYHWQRG